MSPWLRTLVRGALFGALVLSSVGGAGCTRDVKPETYADSARAAFDDAMEVFDDEDWPEAIKRLTTVKNRYAYSQYAATAELRIADAWFAQDKFVEAIDAYRSFVQSRPNHKDVPYALYRIGVAYDEQLPSDFVLFPPAYEKDQAATRDAMRALETFVERHPKDENLPDAQQRLQRCRQLLADYELYVAAFYLRDDRPASARGRLERVVSEFPDIDDRWALAALTLSKVYGALGLTAEARQMANRLVEAHPKRPEADEARRLLTTLAR
jgi:outer membrane protein assembly factor BamD